MNKAYLAVLICFNAGIACAQQPVWDASAAENFTAESLGMHGSAFGCDATMGCDSCNQCPPSVLFGECQNDYVWRIGAWLQQGFTWNPDNPADGTNFPVEFNGLANEYMLNQAYVFVERQALVDGNGWDLGGRFDVLWGTDSRFLGSRGLELELNGTRKWSSDNRRNGMALPQAYAEIAAPVADGLSIKIGHFYSIMGYERAQATDNIFYSHSYSYLYATPFTETGVLASLNLNRSTTLHAGVTEGWDNFTHPGSELSAFAGITWRNECTRIRFTVHSGNERTIFAPAGFAEIDERQISYSFVLERDLTNRLQYVFEHQFGTQENALADVVGPPITAIDFHSAKWYGITQYLTYDINSQWSVGGRFEWFRDQDQRRVLAPLNFVPGGLPFTGGNIWALTSGVSYRPRSNIQIRTEARWDWSDLRGNPNVPNGTANNRLYDDFSDGNQFTLGTDLILAY